MLSVSLRIWPKRSVFQDRRLCNGPTFGQQRRIEKPCERRDGPEDAEHLWIETIAHGQVRFEFPAREKLLEAQISARRVVGQVPLWSPGKLFTIKFADRIAKRRRRHNSMELSMIDGDVRANRAQIRRRGHIHATSDPDPSRCDLEIEPGAFVAREAFGGEVRTDVRFERLLVGAEARVAVDPVERYAGIGDEFRRERGKIPCEASEELDHRTADMLFVLLLAAPEPVAVVIALQ